METFEGYSRPCGRVGVRNHLVVMASVVCSALCVEKAAQVAGAVPITHLHGCAQAGADREQTLRTLVGLGANPNVGGVLVIGLGCEAIPAAEITDGIAATCRKPVGCLEIQSCGGTEKTIARAVAWLEKAREKLSSMPRVRCAASELLLGTECGGSDAFSGLTANPAIGLVADRLVAAGGTVILSETAELLGAEHVLRHRARTPEVYEDLVGRITALERAAKEAGLDLVGANPAPGNIAGGITTLEEKSLGCVHKAGSTQLNEVLDYAQPPSQKGLVFMDTPGYDVESVTGMVAGGANVVVFSTGRGTPVGCAVAPVIKVCSNSRTYKKMQENIDVNAGKVIDGEATLAEIGDELWRKILEVAGGQLTSAERLGHREIALNRIGPSY